MNNVYFLHQIYHDKTNNTWNKGIVIKDAADTNNWDAVRQSYYSYLGAYGYGKNPDIDFVQCEITDLNGIKLAFETWRDDIVEEVIPDEPGESDE